VAAPTHIHQPAEDCTEEQHYAAVSTRSHHVGFVDFQSCSVLSLFSIVEVTYQYLQIIQGFEGALSQSCMFDVMCVSLISGFITFLIVIWILQETVLKVVRPLRYTILFMGVMNCLFSVYDIYDDLISRRVNSSDAENFANICPCPCNGVGWGVIWGFISFVFLLASVYLGLVILS
jgi:hypothetical protein